MKRIGLLGSGAYVPEKILTNQDLESMVETSDEWIVSRTGIKERRLAAEGQHASDLAIAAAKDCLGEALGPDLLISSSGTAERIYPYQASLVAHHLGLVGLAAFDINAACSGFVTGIAVAHGLMNTLGYQRALVTASEKISSYVNYKDRNSCVLFGDGAAALLLGTEGWEHELIACELGLDASGSYLVRMGERGSDPFFWQDGKKVFKFAVTIIGQLFQSLLKKAGLTGQESLYIVPHQANARMMEAVADKWGVPLDRFILNIDRYGNTSSASIGLALNQAWKNNTFKKGDYVFLIGFGGGLSWAGAVIKW